MSTKSNTSPKSSPNVSPVSHGSSRAPEPPLLECPGCETAEGTALLKRTQLNKPDVANTEFVYYSAILREVAPKLSNNVDRQMVIPWIRKLFRPEYHSSRFKVKRNIYLLYLTLTILNDEAYGIFRTIPPAGAMPNLPDILDEQYPSAEWEQDSMWQDILEGIPKEMRAMNCSVHSNQIECELDQDTTSQLDDECRFLLYLIRPFAVLLPNSEDRSNIARWLQTLCTIQPTSCRGMKKLRNEYLSVLLGYIHELRVAGPFVEAPKWTSLPPLAEVARIMLQNRPVLRPDNPDISEFLATQQVPEEGAFCYIGVTGDILNTTLDQLD